MGPSAPAALAPLCTPGKVDCPLSDSTVPMAASTVQGKPGQVAAARWYRVSMAGGILEVAADVAVGWTSMPNMAMADPTTAVPSKPTTSPSATSAPTALLIGCSRP